MHNKILKKFTHGRGYTEADWEAVDSPPLTDAEMRQARPFREMHPDLAAKMEEEIAKRGRPKLVHVKELVSLRIDKDVLEKYRAKGKGWQTHMNKALRKAVGL